MSFGEKRDDGKTKVPTRSTRNASRLGRKKKGTTTTTTRFAPFKDVLYHTKGTGPECDFSSLFNNGREEVFTNDIRKRIKLVDDQSSKRRTSFFPISSAPFLSLSSRVAKRSNQRALASMYWQ